MSCKLKLVCKYCRKTIYLSNKIPGTGRTHFPISEHPTLNETLKVNWKLEYKEEFNCPSCNRGQITRYRYSSGLTCKLILNCNSCDSRISLTCRVPIYIYNYRPEVECPNPLCTDIGHNGQKGWVYLRSKIKNNYQCRFCQIIFNPNSTKHMSWAATQAEKNLSPFVFDEDIWQLGYFYKDPQDKTLNFQDIHPIWYRQKVIKYLHYLLNSQAYSSSEIKSKRSNLKRFGESIVAMKIERLNDITRSTITHFLDICKSNGNKTINNKASFISNFFKY
ncbi:MAG: site-specific integrase [Xenococcaceae cyanobacterium MO_234.B1]|nr:site-specific integrase [Xenococcaceae cyanobacterium MO_234.B1]